MDLTRDEFERRLQDNHRRHNIILKSPPILGGKPLDLFTLYTEVIKNGGIEEVVEKRTMGVIRQNFDFPSTTTAATYIMTRNYIRFLYFFELEHFWDGKRSPNIDLLSKSSHSTSSSSLISDMVTEGTRKDEGAWIHDDSETTSFLPGASSVSSHSLGTALDDSLRKKWVGKVTSVSSFRPSLPVPTSSTNHSRSTPSQAHIRGGSHPSQREMAIAIECSLLSPMMKHKLWALSRLYEATLLPVEERGKVFSSMASFCPTMVGSISSILASYLDMHDRVVKWWGESGQMSWQQEDGGFGEESEDGENEDLKLIQHLEDAIVAASMIADGDESKGKEGASHNVHINSRLYGDHALCAVASSFVIKTMQMGTKGLSPYFPLYVRAFHSTWIDRDIRFNMCDVLISQCRNAQLSSDEMNQICDRLVDMASVVLKRVDDTPETWSLILSVLGLVHSIAERPDNRYQLSSYERVGYLFQFVIRMFLFLWKKTLETSANVLFSSWKRTYGEWEKETGRMKDMRLMIASIFVDSLLCLYDMVLTCDVVEWKGVKGFELMESEECTDLHFHDQVPIPMVSATPLQRELSQSSRDVMSVLSIVVFEWVPMRDTFGTMGISTSGTSLCESLRSRVLPACHTILMLMKRLVSQHQSGIHVRVEEVVGMDALWNLRQVCLRCSDVEITSLLARALECIDLIDNAM
eukprot:TRINITY_DN1993_c2_g1_i1.p1 TRINITY_DN1993_c2_g1~~TRINITY_DN1993_c2_g1_i1.p1  ORF type:complete len:693 (-),score=182.22 TRINITY_DN1993_c2_g1_i1:49-2127(-)